jgi:signal transduction histidine kinase
MSHDIASRNRHNTQKNAGCCEATAASSRNNRRKKNMECCLSDEPDRGKWIQEATREEITTILENVPCGIYVVEGPLGDTIYINQGCYKISGYDIKDVPNATTARKILYPDDKTREEQARYRERMISNAEQGPYLSTIVCKDGQKKICEVRMMKLPDYKLVGVWTDVTRREIAESRLRKREKTLLRVKDELEKRVNERTLELVRVNKELEESREKLRLLSEHLQRAQEEERTRVAREVHDELGQLLTGLKMDLAYYGRHLDKDQSIEGMKSMEKQIDLGIDTVRKICSDLRPHVLERLGLVAAIEWHARNFEKRTGIKCTVPVSSEIADLDDNLQIVLFRAFQEAMTNVARHAHATQVKILLKNRGDTTVLTIKDNGKGITNQDIANPGSFGIIGIRERIRFWGGESTFTGSPNKGTTVTISIPLFKRTKTPSQKKETVKAAAVK